ncbi:MAG: restriction endonuclease [Bryobacteraceae bacterium]
MYDFKKLSPIDFEDLTRDLLQRHWGVRLEAFKTGRDQGIDLRYAALKDHSTIIQCKHFAGSTLMKLVRELYAKELPKVKRLNPDRYVLVTSLPLNPSDKEKLKEALAPHIQTTHDIFGANDLNNLLGLHSEIEIQHFKLWVSSSAVLQRVLHNAEQVQTEFDVERVRRAIPLYVQTRNYSRAMRILEERKIVIISGVPGVGKTTLADMLLFTHLNSSYRPVVIKSEMAEGRRLFNDDLRQIFYFDDFLGETFLGNRVDFLAKKEDSSILDFMEIISRSKHSRFVLTTREHILQHAFQISERFRREKGVLADHRCILELGDYTLLDRGRILYNHIYFSDLTAEYKAELLRNEFYMRILKHRNFNPRLVEWLSRFTNVKQLPLAGYQKEVERLLENPDQLWRLAFEQQISEASRSLLLALYSMGGKAPLSRLEEAWKMLHQHRSRKYNLKSAAEDWRRSHQDLEGGFLVFKDHQAAFVNPSVKDFLDSALATDTEHLDDLLSATCFFEQVVSIWALAGSEKGSRIQRYFQQSPDLLMTAIGQNLQNPHEQRIDFGHGTSGTRARDVRPEVRLRTMLLIADGTQSVAALESAATYTQSVIEFWTVNVPDFEVAVDILQILDQAKWHQLVDINLHEPLKAAILNELTERQRSGDIFAVADYAEGRGSRWTKQNQRALVRSFEIYLEHEFDKEFGDRDSDPGELHGFSETLESIGNWCGVDVGVYVDQISARMKELIRDEEEDDDLPPRQWEDSSQPMSERAQQEEVRRLFDSFQYD